MTPSRGARRTGASGRTLDQFIDEWEMHKIEQHIADEDDPPVPQERRRPAMRRGVVGGCLGRRK
jgi:hypothetical protein